MSTDKDNFTTTFIPYDTNKATRKSSPPKRKRETKLESPKKKKPGRKAGSTNKKEPIMEIWVGASIDDTQGAFCIYYNDKDYKVEVFPRESKLYGIDYAYAKGTLQALQFLRQSSTRGAVTVCSRDLPRAIYNNLQVGYSSIIDQIRKLVPNKEQFKVRYNSARTASSQQKEAERLASIALNTEREQQLHSLNVREPPAVVANVDMEMTKIETEERKTTPDHTRSSMLSSGSLVDDTSTEGTLTENMFENEVSLEKSTKEKLDEKSLSSEILGETDIQMISEELMADIESILDDTDALSEEFIPDIALPKDEEFSTESTLTEEATESTLEDNVVVNKEKATEVTSTENIADRLKEIISQTDDVEEMQKAVEEALVTDSSSKVIIETTVETTVETKIAVKVVEADDVHLQSIEAGENEESLPASATWFGIRNIFDFLSSPFRAHKSS